jgi:tetratricopeptide (TPR) repeat protein/transcriptional regulator with XRE-family HTH domain
VEKTPKPNYRLKRQRELRGWSQKEVADRIDTNTFTVSRWERGEAIPSPYYRTKLCNLFGMNAYELDFIGDKMDATDEHSSHQPPSVNNDDNSPLTVARPPNVPDEPGLLPPPHVPRIWTIPHAHNPFFTGREHLLALLHQRLSTARTAALTQAQTLYGLGGIGKTQAAVEYAFRHGDDYTHALWMHAASRESLVADFVALAALLDLAEQDEQDQQRVVAAVKGWLAAHAGWLLILDNADDLPLAQEFLPTRHQGSLLFTTRAQAAGALAASIEVEPLTPQEGTLLLLRLSKRLDMDTPLEQAQAEDRAEALRIVREVDGLPLALVQAGTYVEETGCSLADYLRLYATHRKDLLARRSRLLLDYSETVATTWSLSFQQVEQANPAAAELLRFCTFLAPDAIPEELLASGAAELGAVLGAAAADPFQLNEALAVLRRYSLLQRTSSTHMLSIHRLVQAVLKESMDQQTQRAWAERTVRAVNAAFPEADDGPDEKQPYYLQYYVSHVQECAMLIKEYHLYFPEAARLLFQAGVFLHFHGLYAQSHSLHQQALAVREQVFGSNHPAVAESLNALALRSRFQGDYEQAERFHQQALAIREKMLGPNHPATAQSLNNLGVLYRTQSKYEQAEPLLHRALIISEQSLGSEHSDTLFALINLAKLYIEQRKYEDAEPLAKQALATSERVLEPGHHIIAQSLNLRARLSYEQRNYEQAETLWKRALALVEKTFGLEHPSTAERLNNLAELYLAQGRLTQAESLCRRALSICEHILGSEHPDTITYRQHLSRIVSKKEAEQANGHYPPAPPGR